MVRRLGCANRRRRRGDRVRSEIGAGASGPRHAQPQGQPKAQGFPPPRAKVWGSSGGGGGGGGSRPVSVGGCNATNQQPAPAGRSLLEASLRASTAQAAAAYGSPARPPRKASIPSAPGSSTHAASITAEAHAQIEIHAIVDGA